MVDQHIVQFEFITPDLEDAHAIAKLHIESWKKNYASILNKAYLERDIENERKVYWQEAIAKKNYWQVILSKTENQSAGFVAVTCDTEAGYDVTVEHLHVAEQFQGLGLGRKLLARVAQNCLMKGKSNVCLRVFEDNQKAIRFYESLGAVTDHYGIDNFAGSQAEDRRMGWANLEPLLKLE